MKAFIKVVANVVRENDKAIDNSIYSDPLVVAGTISVVESLYCGTLTEKALALASQIQMTNGYYTSASVTLTLLDILRIKNRGFKRYLEVSTAYTVGAALTLKSNMSK